MSSLFAVGSGSERLSHRGGVVIGATLLHDGVQRNWLARRVMERNNDRGIFSNRTDSLHGLRSMLSLHPIDPSVEVVGCVGIFTGRV